MKFYNLIYTLFLPVLFQACIGTDLVFDTIDPELRLIDYVNVLGENDTYQFEAVYFNNVGVSEDVNLEWKSSDTSIAEVDMNGWVSGKSQGVVIISVCYVGSDTVLQIDQMIEVDEETIIMTMSRMGTLRSTSSYALTGDFILEEAMGGGLTLSFSDDYGASTALPGLYVYLSNNPSTISGAYEIGAVTVFSGSHSYALPASIGLNDFQYVLYYCKPFNVKVGDGEIN